VIGLVIALEIRLFRSPGDRFCEGLVLFVWDIFGGDRICDAWHPDGGIPGREKGDYFCDGLALILRDFFGEVIGFVMPSICPELRTMQKDDRICAGLWGGGFYKMQLLALM